MAAAGGKDTALRRSIEQDGVSFYWGGNAAKFLGWVDSRSFEERDNLVVKMLTAVARQFLTDYDISFPENGIRHVQSPGHKSEVAGGLVTLGELPGPSEPEESDKVPLVSGEELRLNDIPVKATDEVSPDYINGGGFKALDSSFPRLDRLIQIMNDTALRTGLWGRDGQLAFAPQIQDIRNHMTTGYATAARLEKAPKLEPPFVTAVRRLVVNMSAGGR